MSLRLKLGPFLSVGRTGLRLHLPLGRYGGGSTGRSGTRTFLRLGPLYYNWRKK